jgi:hypothetical protein
MAHDVFVSHSVKDKAVADAVVARLEAGSVSCWIAPHDVVPGADWGESIIMRSSSSRIMILIFSRSADASSQIKREVERAVNKGVYIIPFRVDDIPPTKSLEYFISTSQWMDAFSPPLERHLDNLAKTVTAVLKSPPLPAVNVPAQPERPSIRKPPIRPPWRKSLLIAITIVALVIVGGAGWYLVQKKKGSPEKPTVTPIYAINDNGDMLFYKYAADGSANWSMQAKKIGNGWNFKQVFAERKRVEKRLPIFRRSLPASLNRWTVATSGSRK